jgi:hypothetical protein
MKEPHKVSDLDALHPAFRARLERVMAELETAGVPFSVDETGRTADRQAWHFAKGRTIPGPDLSPERPLGRTVTDCDGLRKLSQHQRGLAADVYPLRPDGRRWIPAPTHEVWQLLAVLARAHGLRPGKDWGDCPHLQWSGPPPRESGAQREGL